MNIATWNVNSLRARMERFMAWLDRTQPDVVCLQELKCTEAAFPFDELRTRGYFAAVWGQPTYNGVAVLCRGAEPTDVVRGLGGEADDSQARFVCARVNGIRIISAYVPNGGEMGSDKYAYKLRWLEELHAWLAREAHPDEPLALLGDFNIAFDAKDVRNVAVWEGTVLFNEELTDHFRRLLTWGLVDVCRRHNPDGGVYTWWDYRNLGFPKNDGLRIDHILMSAPLASRCERAWVDREERKGQKPSDHAPVCAVIGSM